MPVFSKPASQPGVSQHTVEYFNNANNTVIHRGDFRSVRHFTTQRVKKDGFEMLQEHVATTAFHNSMQRMDPPRCHECTREAVLEELFDWIVGNIPREAWIGWINGAAGAGKSAICQSLAEICIQQGVKVASFFFFRTDATRNSIEPVIATLVYQTVLLFPETKQFIIQSIESNPLIFKQTLETQLEVLVVAPIRHFRISETLLLIIDGLDECTGNNIQTNLISTFGRLLQYRDLPLIVLIGSRRESQIQMAFNAQDIVNILKQVSIDNNYMAEEDIHRFLVYRFNEIKLTHPLCRHLKPEWPAAEYVQEITNKSSGQFIYASTVIKFISIPSSSPSTQLDIVRGLRPAGCTTPFAELDALYRHIFSQVEDIKTTLRILAYRLLANYHHLKLLSYFFDITEEDVESILATLTSVLFHDAGMGEIVFHHASLPDFLWDKQRSQEFCISEMGTDLAILWFENAAHNRFSGLEQVASNNILNLQKFIPRAKASPYLCQLLLDYDPCKVSWEDCEYREWGAYVLDKVREIDFGDNGKVYCTLSDRMVRFAREKYPKEQWYMFLHFTTLTEEESFAAQQHQSKPAQIRRSMAMLSRLKKLFR